jgi:hypothetical protein
VQKRQQMGRLSECGHDVFELSLLSPASSSSSPRATNLGRTSLSVIGSATLEDPVEETMETGEEFRDVANELGSEGRQARDRCVLWVLGSRSTATGALAGRRSCW